jgi:ADP-heptose:LPS heptosyltransferase
VKSPRILVIRRDNIGDLVCTTPLLHALRVRYPQAWIGVLANSYNAPVLEGNPDIDQVIAYRKHKHGGVGRLEQVLERLRILRFLRALRLDVVIAATPAWQPRTIALARWMKARRLVAFVPAGQSARGVTDPIALESVAGLTEAEQVYAAAPALDLPAGPPGPPTVVADPAALARLASVVAAAAPAAGPRVGFHISARKPSQRWPLERFAEAIRQLHASQGIRPIVLWAPGASDSPTHPGDDERARTLRTLLGDCPALFIPTHTLRDLIAALALCDRVVLADGGAMHLAAGLGKPIVCLFGQSDAFRWRPWGVPCRLLQTASRDVSDISTAEVLAAYHALQADPREKEKEAE